MRNTHKPLVYLVQNVDILGLLCRSRTLEAIPAACLARVTSRLRIHSHTFRIHSHTSTAEALPIPHTRAVPAACLARLAAHSLSHLDLLTLGALENTSETLRIGSLLSAASWAQGWVLHQMCAHNSARRMCTFCYQSTRDCWSTLRIAR